MVLSLLELVKKYPKRDVKALFQQFFEEELSSQEEIVRENLKSSEDHLELVRAVASCFLPGTQLSIDTGYEFRFTEPLFEKGVKNFDMLISNRDMGGALFVESKTFKGSISARLLKDKFDENRKRMIVVEKEISTLSEKVRHTIDEDSIEVAMIVDMVHVDDLMHEYNRVEMEECYKPIILYYDRMKGTLNMVEGFHLRNRILERELLEGIPIHEIGGMMSIPCLISDHPFQILRNVIINVPTATRSIDGLLIKDFSRDDIKSGLERIPLHCSRIERNQILNETTNKVIEHCLHYDIISKKDEEENGYRLLCKGNKRSVVDQELYNKYVRNWSRRKADIKARERVEKEYGMDKKLDEFK